MSNTFHSKHAEEAVVAMMILSKYGQNEALTSLQLQDFVDEKLSLLFKTIKEMNDRGQEVDIVTIVEALKAENNLTKAGGFEFISSLVDSVASADNIASYIQIVTDKALFRKLNKACLNINDLITNSREPLEEILNGAEKEILAITRKMGKATFNKANNFILKAAQKIHNLNLQGINYTGLTTGFKAFDKLTSGLQNGDYIILAARPSMGKTAFALNLLLKMAKLHHKPVALFSLEMPVEQIANRLLAIEGQINLSHLKAPSFLTTGEKERMHLAAEELAKLPVYINDATSLTAVKILANARKLHAESGGLACIVIDYLTLIQGSGRRDNRVLEVSDISAVLKGLARELNIPVIVLSQLSRKVESRENKKPMLSDIRDSGAVEQDADVVAFLYREDYHKQEGGSPLVDVHIAKHRNGPVGEFHLAFDKKTGKFSQ